MSVLIQFDGSPTKKWQINSLQSVVKLIFCKPLLVYFVKKVKKR